MSLYNEIYTEYLIILVCTNNLIQTTITVLFQAVLSYMQVSEAIKFFILDIS